MSICSTSLLGIPAGFSLAVSAVGFDSIPYHSAYLESADNQTLSYISVEVFRVGILVLLNLRTTVRRRTVSDRRGDWKPAFDGKQHVEPER
jgi:hypothetical protein